MSGDVVAELINAMACPVRRVHRHGAGIDLKPSAAELSALLNLIGEAYELAEDDWHARNSNGAPKKKLEKNFSRLAGTRFDYKDFRADNWEEEFLKGWSAHYQRFFARPVGNQGLSRTGKGARLPLGPLEVVYYVLKTWWIGLGRRWRPALADHVDVRRAKPEDMNLPLRMFLIVARWCDNRYSLDHCLRVCESIKRRNRLKKRVGP